MAKRRWGTGKRLAYGLSEGLSNFLTDLRRTRMADKQAERTGRLQEERDMRTLARQGEMQAGQQAFQARQTALTELPALVESLGPDAAQSMLDARGVDLFPPNTPIDEEGAGEYGREREAGQAATGALVQSMRPPMRRKLESKVGEHISKATTPEALSESDIMGQILAADDRVTPPEDEPGMRIGGIRPEAYEYVARAQDKAEALRSKPDQRVSGVNPDGSAYDQMMSSYDMTKPVTTGLTSEQEGTNKGKEELATLGVVGQARVKQGAAEAGAAGRARAQAEIDTKLANQKALIEFDVAKATAELGVIGAEVDARQYATQIAEAREAASKAGPVITELQNTWLNAQPVLEQWAGVTGGAGLSALESAPDWAKDSALVNYDKYVDAVRPLLARAFGQTGNPALMEQEWAKYTPSYMMGLRPDDALRQLARLETLLLSQVQMAQLARQKGTALTGADIDAIIAPRIESVYQQLKGQADEMRRGRIGGGARPMTVPGASQGTIPAGTSFILGPNGLQLAPPKED